MECQPEIVQFFYWSIHIDADADRTSWWHHVTGANFSTDIILRQKEPIGRDCALKILDFQVESGKGG